MADIPIVIIAHPRSGTGYASQVLQSLGLDVGHERLGEDGISSWMWARRDARTVPWGEAPCGRSSDLTIHLVRDPYRTLESTAKTEDLSLEWRRQGLYTPARASPYDRDLVIMHAWHAMCTKQADIRVSTERFQPWAQRYFGRHMRHPVQPGYNTRVPMYAPTPNEEVRKQVAPSLHWILDELETAWLHAKAILGVSL